VDDIVSTTFSLCFNVTNKYTSKIRWISHRHGKLSTALSICIVIRYTF